MILWSAAWVSKDVIMTVTAQDGPALPYTVAFFRFLTASFVFAVAMTATGKPPHRRYSRSDMKTLLPLGILGVFAYPGFELFGVYLSTAAQGAIIDGAQPAVITVLAFVFLRERLTKPWQYGGLVLGFLGVVFVVGVQFIFELNTEYLLGNILLLIAVVIWGLYTTFGKSAMQRLGSLEMTAGSIFVATPAFGIAAVFEQFWNRSAITETYFWLNILFLGGVIACYCFTAYFKAVEKIGATRASVFLSLTPVTGTILSALLVPDQPLHWTLLVGLVFVVVAIVIMNYPTRKHAAEATAGDPQEK